MKNPYDKNGLPRNICFGMGDDYAGVIAWFINLPKTKYFDEETWVFYFADCSVMRQRVPAVNSVLDKANFSSLTPSDREFIMQFYVDTFGRPEDWRGDTFVG